MSAAGRKIAFITGAASGIGRATAERFAENGWWIGAADRNTEGPASLRDAIGEDSCRLFELDVTDAAAWGAVVAALGEETGGRLDLLFNNAGIAARGFFEEISLEENLRVVDVNLIGVIRGIYAALPLLKATPNSVCFSTSSSSAIYGAPGGAVYAATKFAVKGLTEALAIELSRCGVRVADVLPGLVDTAILHDSPVYSKGRKVEGRAVSASAPAEGPYRLVPPSMVAEAVWRCVEGDPRLHWYVPAELQSIDKSKAADPEAMRDARIAIQRARLEAARGD